PASKKEGTSTAQTCAVLAEVGCLLFSVSLGRHHVEFGKAFRMVTGAPMELVHLLKEMATAGDCRFRTVDALPGGGEGFLDAQRPPLGPSGSPLFSPHPAACAQP